MNQDNTGDNPYKNRPPWVLALKWDCDATPPVYNMHGLWYDRGEEPSSDHQAWDPSMVNDHPELLKRMEKEWNSSMHADTSGMNPEERADTSEGDLHEDDRLENIRLKADLHFWSHEWDKHGRVSGMKPLEYFLKAFQLFDRVKDKVSTQKIGGSIQFGFDEDFNQIPLSSH